MKLNQVISVNVHSGETPSQQYKTVILKPNIVDNVNTLTQLMVNQTNTKYVIKYDYTLGEDITVPSGCVLEFDGGKVDNGAIFGNNTTIEYEGARIFGNAISLSGTWNVTLSPIMFGVLDSSDAYDALKKTHSIANEINSSVSYNGIGELNIHVTEGMTSIEAGRYTDFCGCTINVVNNSVNDFVLFKIQNNNKSVSLSIQKENIDNGNLSEVVGLTNNPSIIVIKDEEPWVQERQGYSNAVYRYDVIFSVDKVAQNAPIYNYNTDLSRPSAYCKEVTMERKVFKNLTLNRIDSTLKTLLIDVSEQNNVELSDITIITDTSYIYGELTPEIKNRLNEKCISFTNCTNIFLTSINFDNTYSRKDYSGYGFNLNNVFNVVCEKIICKANWGLFDGNNINKATLRDCVLNRFDAHNYGRDFYLNNCYGTALQCESFFGCVKFEGCTLPNEPVYGTKGYISTEYDMVIKNCHSLSKTIHLNAPGYFDREERADVNGNMLPNIEVDGLDGAETVYLFKDTWVASSGLIVKFNNAPVISVRNIRGVSPKVKWSNQERLWPANAVPIYIENCNNVYFGCNWASYDPPTLPIEFLRNVISKTVYKNCKCTNLSPVIGNGYLNTIDVVLDDCYVEEYWLYIDGQSHRLEGLIMRNCFVVPAISTPEGDRSFVWGITYDHCTIKIPNNNRISTETAGDSFYGFGAVFSECINAEGSAKLFNALGEMRFFDFSIVGPNIFKYNKNIVFQSKESAPELGGNFVADGYCTSLYKKCHYDGTGWKEEDGATLGVPRRGTFEDTPEDSDIYIGFRYFCTNRYITEASNMGIEILYKGNNVWVNALGAEVS